MLEAMPLWCIHEIKFSHFLRQDSLICVDLNLRQGEANRSLALTRQVSKLSREITNDVSGLRMFVHTQASIASTMITKFFTRLSDRCSLYECLLRIEVIF